MMYLYNARSAFRRIARELGIGVVYPYEPRTIHRRNHMQCNINIGCVRADLPEDTLNRDLSVAISKRKTFDRLDAWGVEGLRHPPTFQTPEEAAEWPYGWLGRRDGLSAGKGISVFAHGQLPLQAAQYDFITGILPGAAEYRIHVGKMTDSEYKVIATQQKMNVHDNENVVRNHANGVIYSTQELRMSSSGRERIVALAVAAVTACGLDFGAVDFLQTKADIDPRYRNRLYVLEVNTAPGVSSAPMFQAYKEYIRSYLHE